MSRRAREKTDDRGRQQRRRKTSASASASSSSSSSSSGSAAAESPVDLSEDEEEPFLFSQSQPEACVLAPDDEVPDDDAEQTTTKKKKNKAQKITEDEYNELVANMMRYIFMRGCAKEPIVLNKLNDDVLGDKYRKVAGLNKDIFLKAKENLGKIFGFKLLEAPSKHFPQAKFKGCYFVITAITNPHFRRAVQDEHCVALQGLLMVVLSIAYSSNHSSQSHKISEPNLVKYLEKLDSTTSKSSRERAFGLGDWNAIIDLFCKQHYLLKEKIDDADGEPVSVLSLGPRGFLEVGRRQIISFSYDVVGQSIDESILAELEDGEEGEEEDDAEE